MGEGQSLRTGETDSGLAASHGKRVLLRGNFQARKAFKYDGRRMMVRKYASALAVFVVLLAVLPLAAQSPSQADLSAIHQIKEAGFGDKSAWLGAEPPKAEPPTNHEYRLTHSHTFAPSSSDRRI